MIRVSLSTGRCVAPTYFVATTSHNTFAIVFVCIASEKNDRNEVVILWSAVI